MSGYHVKKKNQLISWGNVLQFTLFASFAHQNILCGGFPSHLADENN